MKILHTADWHLGKSLYAKKDREKEHTAFLEWLLKTIADEKIDLLLIAGDIFDTATPSSTAQKMYYDFLIKVKNKGCNHVIVIGGNHDSPSFLNAPKDILAALNIAVIGHATDNLEDEILVIRDNEENPLIIICGVPFLRTRDISHFVEAENYTDRSKRINESIKRHYERIAALAENKRNELNENIPIVATGHLSVLGGKRNEDDGVREIHIGNIEAVGSDIFPKTFDYVALGHYHIPSIIEDHIRYCGSPIPMGFGEAEERKCVYSIDFNNGRNIETIEIPVFQKLESVIGDNRTIANRLNELKRTNSSVWVEIIYEGNNIFPNFGSWANEQVSNSKIEILKLQNRRLANEVLTENDTQETLKDITELDVFNKMLEKNGIRQQQQIELKQLYNEIVISLHEND